jgi:NADH-quinone oxidoreductase subunit F
MDLHFLDARPTDEERDAVDAVVGPPSSGWHGGDRTPLDAHVAFGGREALQARRPLLLPALHAVNDRVGWVSQGALNYVAQRLEVAPAEAYGVLSFYALLSPVERPRRIVHVCTDLACRQGATALTAGLGPEGRPQQGDPAAWHPSPCLGVCERAPAALVVEAGPEPRAEVVAPATADHVRSLLRGEPAADEPAPAASVPQQGDEDLVLLRRVGRVDPSSLADYRVHGGDAALRRALDIGPAAVIREVVDSKLMGRGGAAFPTGRKWEAVAGQPARPHHLVCNADESEPGTFKDRVLMEGDPFAVIEAMTVAGLTTPAVYVGSWSEWIADSSRPVVDGPHRG